MRKVNAGKLKIDAQGHCSKFKSNAKMSFEGLANFPVSSGCLSGHQKKLQNCLVKLTTKC